MITIPNLFLANTFNEWLDVINVIINDINSSSSIPSPNSIVRYDANGAFQISDINAANLTLNSTETINQIRSDFSVIDNNTLITSAAIYDLFSGGDGDASTLEGNSLTLTGGTTVNTFSLDFSSINDYTVPTANAIYNLLTGKSSPLSLVSNQFSANNISIGGLGVLQSTSQSISSVSGLGNLSSPYVYTAALEAYNEKGAFSTGILLGNKGISPQAELIPSDTVGVFTNGYIRFKVENDGSLSNINAPTPSAPSHLTTKGYADSAYAPLSGNSAISFFANNIGIGTTSLTNTKLLINSGTLGTTAGDVSNIMTLSTSVNNNSKLNFYSIRTSNGTDWTTSAIRIQAEVDTTEMAHIQFNGDTTNHEITLGTNNIDRMIIENGGNIVSNTNFTINDGFKLFTDKIQTKSGNPLILNVGESGNYAAGQTLEYLYINSESGIELNTTDDNWTSGWLNRVTSKYSSRYISFDNDKAKMSANTNNILFQIKGSTPLYQNILNLNTSNTKFYTNVLMDNDLFVVGTVVSGISDDRLKTNKTKLNNVLEKLDQLEGFTYQHNDLAKSLGFDENKTHVGVSAQQVKNVLPELTRLSPVDDDGNGNSISGENYLTVDYSKLSVLLLEAIKEIKQEVSEIKSHLKI